MTSRNVFWIGENLVSYPGYVVYIIYGLHIRSARAAGSSSVSIAVDKETTLTELKSLVADQDLVKTNLSVVIDLADTSKTVIGILL